MGDGAVPCVEVRRRPHLRAGRGRLGGKSAVEGAAIDHQARKRAVVARVGGQEGQHALDALHADPGIARDAGFPRPISHGLNNLGLACRAILRHGVRPASIRQMAVRFVGPGLPGDTVRVEIFDGGAGTLRFRATALERDVRLLDRGLCRVEG